MSEVSWDETIAPGSSGVFDASTMPHRLVRGVGDVFVLEPIPWKDRQVGDKDSNPYPTFIQAGTPINNLGVFQNRLFSTSSETVLLSASDAFFDLWRESAFYNTDADPFERFADTKELNILQYAEEFDGDLTKVGISEERQVLMQILLARYCRVIGGWSKDDLKKVIEQEEVLLVKDLKSELML